MDLIPQIYTAKVMHKRLFPRVNQFVYGVYYVVLPLPAAPLPSRLMRFDHKDYGPRDGSDVEIWARHILSDYGLNPLIEHIILITMPRVVGYGFNPVSFFMCLDQNKQLRAVICEVHNTFGEQHSYLCARPDHAPIDPDEWLQADKVFHVSPFLPRNGRYHFRFSVQRQRIGIGIDYDDAEGRKQLLTTLTGTLAPLDASSLNRAFWSHPLVTVKVIFLIHLQAMKLLRKKIRYLTKPLQFNDKITPTSGLAKHQDVGKSRAETTP